MTRKRAKTPRQADDDEPVNPLYVDESGELVNPDYTEEMRARALEALREKRKGEDLEAMFEAYVLAIFHALQRTLFADESSDSELSRSASGHQQGKAAS